MNEQNDLFEAYLKGRLSAEKQSAFEEDLRTDQDMATAFQEFKTMFDLVNAAGENELKDVLDGIHKEMESIEISSGTGHVLQLQQRKRIAVAASVFLLFGLLFFLNSRSPSADTIYAQHIAPYELPDRTRSENKEAEPWRLFTAKYQAQNFDEALGALQNVSELQKPKYLISLYKGICFQLKEDPDLERSVAALDVTLASDNDFHSIAHWYAGLAALKMKELEKARTHFEKVVDQKGFKHQEASSILEEITDL